MKELTFTEFVQLKLKTIINESLTLDHWAKTRLYDVIYDLPKFMDYIGYIPSIGEEMYFITKIAGEILLLSTVDNKTTSIYTVSKTLGMEFLFTPNETYYARNDMLFLI